MGESRRRVGQRTEPSPAMRFFRKEKRAAVEKCAAGEKRAAVVPMRGTASLGAEEAQARRDLTPGCATRSFMESYELGRMLGDGAFGEVWECRDRATGETLACKVTQKRHGQSAAERGMLAQEVSALRLCQGRCPGAIQLVEALETERAVQMVTEICTGGDLCELVRTKGRLPEAAARLVLRQLATALRFCHSHGLVHRDVKPENILFDRPAGELYFYTSAAQEAPRVHAKLADFGLSVGLKPGETTSGYAGSHRYAAPEVIQGKAYGRRADVWSLGVVLYVMLSGKLPFSGKTGDDMEGLKRAIAKGKVDLNSYHWRGVSDEAKDLVRSMLQVDPAKRITSFDLVNHPWVVNAGQAQGQSPSTAASPSSAPPVPTNPLTLSSPSAPAHSLAASMPRLQLASPPAVAPTCG